MTITTYSPIHTTKASYEHHHLLAHPHYVGLVEARWEDDCFASVNLQHTIESRLCHAKEPLEV